MDDVDLELLADAYRHRAISEAAADRVVASCSGVGGVAIDIGGGAGDHARVMRRCGLAPVVVDASPAMCAGASARGIPTIVGRSEALPIRDGVAGLVHFSLSIHYGDWSRALDEALRVLGGVGRIDIWTLDPSSMDRSALAQWFPSVADIDGARFPAIADLAGHLADGGLDVGVSVHPETVERTAGSWVTAARSRFVSTLQLIDDDELERGIAAFTAHHEDPSATYRYILEYVRISADR